jgi:transposase-like protein
MNRPGMSGHSPFLGKDVVTSGGSSKRYPPELRERAVRMVAEISYQDKSEWAAIVHRSDRWEVN